MAKFIKSKFRVLWGTVFSFFAGFFMSTTVSAQEVEDQNDTKTEEEAKEEADYLSPGAIAYKKHTFMSFMAKKRFFI